MDIVIVIAAIGSVVAVAHADFGWSDAENEAIGIVGN